MPKELMSDAELRRRKRVQGHLSQTTGALGLAALGGTLAASRGGRNALRKIPQLKNKIKAPPPKDPNADKIKGAVNPLLATGAGLGGLGSFNFAAYTNAESRKRQAMKPVVKKSNDQPLEMGFYGEEGRPIKLPKIEVPIEKAWSPVASNFDSERSRGRRNEAYGVGAQVASGGAFGYAGGKGLKAIQEAKGAKVKSVTPAETVTTEHTRKNPSGKSSTYKKTKVVAGKPMAVREVGAFKPALKAGRRAAAGLAVGGALVAGGKALKRKHDTGWQPYSKSDTTSAFGIDHRLDS